MHLYPFKVPRIARALLGGIVWQMEPGLRRIYLTFDDGPVPEATPWVLRRLEDRRRHSEARAAMTGSGIRRFRLIVNELLCGRYFRYGRGWLNVVQDLLLRT